MPSSLIDEEDGVGLCVPRTPNASSKLDIGGHNLACQNLGKKQKVPLPRESSWELRIVSGGGSDENTDGGSGRSRLPSGSGERQLAQRAAKRSAADLQDVRRHLSSGH